MTEGRETRVAQKSSRYRAAAVLLDLSRRKLSYFNLVSFFAKKVEGGKDSAEQGLNCFSTVVVDGWMDGWM